MGRGSEDTVGFDLGGCFEAGFNAPPVLGSWEDPGSLTQAPPSRRSLTQLRCPFLTQFRCPPSPPEKARTRDIKEILPIATSHPPAVAEYRGGLSASPVRGGAPFHPSTKKKPLCLCQNKTKQKTKNQNPKLTPLAVTSQPG